MNILSIITILHFIKEALYAIYKKIEAATME